MNHQQIIADAELALSQEQERLRQKDAPEPTVYEWVYSAFMNLKITLSAKPELGRQRQCYVEQIGKLLRAVELIDKGTPTTMKVAPPPHEKDPGW